MLEVFMARYAARVAPSAFGSSPGRGAKTLMIHLTSVKWFTTACQLATQDTYFLIPRA